MPDKTVTSPDIWQELWVLLAVAQTGNLTGAAKVLGTTHPTVSRRLEVLERRVGYKVVHRASHSIILTEQGEKLAELAQQMDLSITRQLEEQGLENKGLSGSVRINVTDALLLFWLAPQLPKFTERYPQISLKFSTSHSPTDFRSGECDLEINFYRPVSQDLIFSRLGLLKLQPFASTGYIEQFGLPTTDNLVEHFFVENTTYGTDDGDWSDWQTIVRQGRKRHGADTGSGYYSLIKYGSGIGLLANYAALDEGLQVLDLGVSIALPFYAVYLKGAQTNPLIRPTVDWIHNLFRSVGQKWFADGDRSLSAFDGEHLEMMQSQVDQFGKSADLVSPDFAELLRKANSADD